MLGPVVSDEPEGGQPRSSSAAALAAGGTFGVAIGVAVVATDAALAGGLVLVAIGSGLVARALFVRRDA